MLGTEADMDPADPRHVVQAWVDAWNAHDAAAVGALTGPDFRRHDANLPDIVGPEAEEEFVSNAVAAFPDLHFSVEHVLVDGELVADHLTGTGTHRGTSLDIPATGREVRFQTMETYRVERGRIVEQWVVMDVLGLLQQLGALPAAASA